MPEDNVNVFPLDDVALTISDSTFAAGAPTTRYVPSVLTEIAVPNVLLVNNKFSFGTSAVCVVTGLISSLNAHPELLVGLA